MNVCFITCLPEAKQISSAEEFREAWHAGYGFKVYKHPNVVDVHSSLKLRMAQFTHVRFVYTDGDGQVRHHDEELK